MPSTVVPPTSQASQTRPRAWLIRSESCASGAGSEDGDTEAIRPDRATPKIALSLTYLYLLVLHPQRLQ